MNGHITSTDNHLGNKIKILRRKNYWTQDAVAERLGVSVPAFSKIETGLTTINMTRLKQLAGIFNTSVHQLLHSSKGLQTKEEEAELEELQAMYKAKTKELMDLQIMAIKLYEELLAKRAKRKK